MMQVIFNFIYFILQLCIDTYATSWDNTRTEMIGLWDSLFIWGQLKSPVCHDAWFIYFYPSNKPGGYFRKYEGRYNSIECKKNVTNGVMGLIN